LCTKVHQLFFANVEGIVVDQLLFRFSICGSVPEIFAIKVESCQKLRRILNVFSPSQILGGRPSNNCTHVTTPGSRHVVRINICHGTSINSEDIDAHTMYFKPNFKFSRLNIFFETPIPAGVCVRYSIDEAIAREQN